MVENIAFKKNCEDFVRNLIGTLPNRSATDSALIDTPTRFSKMMQEQLAGEFVTNADIAEMYTKTFPYEYNSNNLILVDNIECFSHCEHHLALMYNMHVDIAYVPADRILGLSKFARIVDIISKRLQTQEKMGADIMEVLKLILGQRTPIIIKIRAEHSCMTARGIKKPGSYTQTIHENEVTESMKQEFLEMVGK